MYALVSLGPSYFAIIFTLMTEVIALYIQVTILQIGVMQFEKPIGIVPKTCWSLILSLFDLSFYELSKEYIGGSWFWNRRRLRAGRCKT